jgi:rhodanese-related sulfurtransferase
MDGEIDPAELSALLAERDAPDGDSPDDDGPDAGDAAGPGDGAPDGLRVVDIRDRRAFDRGHIAGSECIPFPELTSRVAELDGADRVVTVCPHGVASKQAAQLIGSYAGTADARVESLRGGIEAWERDAGELVPTADGERTDSPDAGDADEGPEAPF